jgi:hypothetical protein
MVIGQRSYPPPLSADTASSAAALGHGPLPAELFATAVPSPSGEPVPGFGYLTLTPGSRDTFASYVLATHRVDGGPLVVRLAWPPVAVNHGRRCGWCRNPWPCAAVEWAHTARAQAAIGYAL